MDPIQMDHDDAAWERSDEMFDAFKKRLLNKKVMFKIAELIQRHRSGSPVELHFPKCGSFNIAVRLEFADGSSLMIRFPVGGRVMLPTEKLLTEVAAIRFIADNTTIRLPSVFHVDPVADESPSWWLLLEHPHKWAEGLDDWECRYAHRLETFLELLREAERELLKKNMIRPGEILSTRMRESWASGQFWVEYAVQKPWAFDHIWFNRLGERSFGKLADGEDWLTPRLPLLSEVQREGMESFIHPRGVLECELRISVLWHSDRAVRDKYQAAEFARLRSKGHLRASG